MRSDTEYDHVRRLIAQGRNDCEIACLTHIPRRTIWDWRNRRRGAPRRKRAEYPLADLPRPAYAYLLGMYLGDGHISRYPRTWRLRISLDLGWPRIMLLCADAMERVFPTNRVSLLCENHRSRCAVASVWSNHLVTLFPQHGPGPKHLRRIELVEWQTQLVDEQTKLFLRGLIHSDGCRFINRVRVNGKTYEYPRYNFTNASGDIRTLFTDACNRLGIEWRQMNARNISVARRESVALLDTFVGPKS
jgi:hypothetical protein